MSTPYQKGRRVEYQLANELREQGWTVIRSAGSKGPADLVAWRDCHVEIIQVKRCQSQTYARQRIREAIAKFEATGIRVLPFVVFSIWLRYQGRWIRLWRISERWVTASEYEPLLGQTEWPITEREE